MRYFMRWPVLDHGLTLSVLHAEATDDLAEQLEDEGLVAHGPIEFLLEGVETAEGECLELHASVPVRRFRSERIRRAAA